MPHRLLVVALVLSTSVLACDEGAAPAVTTAPVTYYRDIVPLLTQHCTGCHHPGGAGPMALDALAPVREAADLALGAMRAGVMPPWMPDRSCRTYVAERGMDAAEIDTFARWVAAGMPAGDAADAPAAAAPSSWTPTDTVVISDAHRPDPAFIDDYHCFVLDRAFPDDTYLTASQVVAGSSQVHHVLVYAIAPDRAADVAAADLATPGPGYTCFGGPIATGGADNQSVITNYFLGGPLPNLSLPAQVGAWVPGSQPMVFPAGSAMRIPRGAVLVAQVHYNLSEGAPVPDSSRIELQLTQTPPSSLVDVRPLAVRSLIIPAGEAEAENVGWFGYYGDAPRTITGLAAHMHLLGTSFRAEVVRKLATAGEGSEPECALAIPRWDFHWQQSYRLRDDDRIVLQDGDGIRVTCTYDNSADNQPALGGVVSAPKDVSWGEGTGDEMCILYYSAIVPFTPPPTPGGTACGAAADCVAACGESPSADCIFACPTADASCDLCALRAGVRCSEGACIAPLQAAQACLGRCLSASVMLGSNAGRCMASECGEAYTGLVQCLDASLDASGCKAELAACGVDFSNGL